MCVFVYLPSLLLFLYPFISTLCCPLLLPFLCPTSCSLKDGGVQLGGLKSNVHVASALANEKARSKPESMAMESLQQCVRQLLLPWRHQQPIWMLWYPTGIIASKSHRGGHTFRCYPQRCFSFPPTFLLLPVLESRDSFQPAPESVFWN